MDIFNFDNIIALSIEPDQETKLIQWIKQDDVIPFLEKDARDENLLIFASLPHVFINTIFLPTKEIKDFDKDDLMKWDVIPDSTWIYACSSDEIWIEKSLQHSRSENIREGEQIIFNRTFEGDATRSNYFEINQKLSHILEIHHVPERNAWCSLDNLGNLIDVVKIYEISNLQYNKTGTIISANSTSFGKYATLNDSILCRMFDFTRFQTGNFHGWNNDTKPKKFGNNNEIFGKLAVEEDNGSYSRGVQLINISFPKEQIINDIWGKPREDETKEYVKFIAQDWKNRITDKISCDPSCLASYYRESDLPFEITPAFFKPEVLLKYKADTEKYDLESRSVRCRGSWYLETFDVNEAGQVHTYLIYLSRLPNEEQLHWKQYNEEPKAPLSKRAIMTDIKGEFYEEYDPLFVLKNELRNLHRNKANWWSLRGERTLNKAHYPYTPSIDEWADEILHLDQLVVEGLEEKWLRKKAEELGRKPDNKLRSLKLLEECLIGFGFDPDHAHKIMSPFHDIHNYRSVLKGHAAGEEAKIMRNQALNDFGTFRKHYESLCSKCEESLGIIIEEFS